DDADIPDFLVRHGEKLVKKAEFVDHLESRCMYGIAAEIAKEVVVFFEYGDTDAGAGGQIAEHDSGRPAHGDAAGRFDQLTRQLQTGRRWGDVCFGGLTAAASFRAEDRSDAAAWGLSSLALRLSFLCWFLSFRRLSSTPRARSFLSDPLTRPRLTGSS